MCEFTAEIRSRTDFNASTKDDKSSLSVLASVGDNTGVSNTKRSEHELAMVGKSICVIPSQTRACLNAPDTVFSLSSMISTITLSMTP